MKDNKNNINTELAKKDPVYRMLKFTLITYKIGGVFMIFVAFMAIFFNLIPGSWYFIDRGAVDQNADLLVNSQIKTVSAAEIDDATLTRRGDVANSNLQLAKSLPSKNLNLPTATTLVVPQIGINAIIHGGTDGNAALDKGVWQQSVQGDPSKEGTIVFASHRWGLLSWSADYRAANSFNKLPELIPGQEFSVYHDQRDYKYKVLRVYEVDGVIETDADLVLYTCKYFRSSQRIVVEAERI